MSGFSAVIGSWKTIAIRLPRMRRELPLARGQQVLADAVEANASPRRCSPSGSRPIIASAVSDLPDPDSPMRPTRSPARRA